MKAEVTATANEWMVSATACELLAIALRVPDGALADAVASGEFRDAALEVADALGLALPSSWAEGLAAPLAAKRMGLEVDGAPAPEGGARDVRAPEGDVTAERGAGGPPADPAALLHALRAEHTRLFVGAPDPAVSPYEGVWRAADDGVQALLFVNPHSMDVERFCRSCGLGRPEGTNEPLDSAATELELLEYLALRAATAEEGASGAVGDPASGDASVAAAAFGGAGAPSSDGGAGSGASLLDGGSREAARTAEAGVAPAVDDVALPGGSPAAAYGVFLADHASTWLPRFADAVARESRLPFYRSAAALLQALLA